MKKSYLIAIAIFIIAFSSKAQETESFTDSRDGKNYKTVVIGTQIWMADNLAFKAQSGCWTYLNDKNNVEKYGYLYNWPTANKVCPSGWSLPAKKDFEKLLDNLGVDDWETYKALMSNGSSGFKASQGGLFISKSYQFVGLAEIAVYWSSTKYSVPNVIHTLRIDSYDYRASIGNQHQAEGLSVRCLKD